MKVQKGPEGVGGKSEGPEGAGGKSEGPEGAGGTNKGPEGGVQKVWGIRVKVQKE